MTTRRRFWTLMLTAVAAVGLTAHGFGAPPAGKGKDKLTLSVAVVPDRIAEGEAAVGVVSHNNVDLSSPVEVTLSSSDTSEALVPASITIPAGENAVLFPIDAVDDGTPDGDQVVTVTASATDYQSGSAGLTVTDALPVRYTIEVVPVPTNGGVWINGLTNNSFVFGWYADTVDNVTVYRSGWVYDQVGGVFYDLNQEATLLAQVETQLGPGWAIDSVVGMNDASHMTGYLEDSTGARKGYVIDTSLEGQFSPDPENWLVRLLPDFGSDFSYGRRINQNGGILGIYRRADSTTAAYLYNPWLDTPESPMPAQELGVTLRNVYTELNNLGQVVGVEDTGAAFFFDPATSQWDWFSDGEYLRISGLNDSGVFSGDAYKVKTYAGGTKQRRAEFIGFRYTSMLEPLNPAADYTHGINSDSDVGFTLAGSSDPAISHTGFAPDYVEHTLMLTDLIADNDPLKTTFRDYQPELFAINDRDGTGYGQAVVRLYGVPQSNGTTLTNMAVILTPFIP